MSIMGYEVKVLPEEPNMIEISNVCPFCGKTHSFKTDASEFKKGLNVYIGGALIQNAWPYLTASQRELMNTGICDECYDKT